MPTRFRCNACGNLTRFDVVATRRTHEFHHYTLGGDLTVEESELLEERIEQVTCRWCAATGEAIEAQETHPPDAADASDATDPSLRR